MKNFKVNCIGKPVRLLKVVEDGTLSVKIMNFFSFFDQFVRDPTRV